MEQNALTVHANVVALVAAFELAEKRIREQRFNALAGGKNLRPQQSEEDRLRAEIAKARAENERLKKNAA